MQLELLLQIFRGLYLLFKEQHLRDKTLFQFITQHPAFSTSIILNMLFAVLLVVMTNFANQHKQMVIDREQTITELKAQVTSLTPTAEQQATAERLQQVQNENSVLQTRNQSLTDENGRLTKENKDLRSQRPQSKTTKPTTSRRRPSSPDSDSNQVNDKLKKLDYLRSL